MGDGTLRIPQIMHDIQISHVSLVYLIVRGVMKLRNNVSMKNIFRQLSHLQYKHLKTILLFRNFNILI